MCKWTACFCDLESEGWDPSLCEDCAIADDGEMCEFCPGWSDNEPAHEVAAEARAETQAARLMADAIDRLERDIYEPAGV